MMRSLRTRFFLISWPLVVAAVVVVAFSMNRWTRQEIERFETLDSAPAPGPARQELAHRVATAWAEVQHDGQGLLRRLAAELANPIDLALIGVDGTALAFSSPEIELDVGPSRPIGPGAAAQPGGVRRFIRLRKVPGATIASQEVIAVTGVAVVDARGKTLAFLYLLPAAPPLPATADLLDRARRTLWITVLAASAAAAAAAWLLAGPLVAQVGRLEQAARRLAAGELEARVVDRGGHGRRNIDELGRLEHSFNSMAEALQRAEAQKRNLVSDVAHELRTPLTNLVGLLEAIDDGLRSPDATTLVSLREEVDLLAALVAELQELALAESGQLRFELEELDAVAAALGAVEVSRGLVAGQELGGPTATTPMLVKADRRRLGQVLRNLIKNALTHTPAGGLVRVDVERRANSVAWVVRDTGRGIPPEHLPLVWERFHRVDPSRQRGSGGMGLGLAVVRHLVAGMGGTVEVESREGFGSTFTVLLPALDVAGP